MSRIIAIHDLSLWSKSSLSVVLPVLEAMTHEVFILPTMILSTQSDGFDDLLEKDFSDSLIPFYEKVKSYGYSFDAVYSGYLGTPSAASSVKKIIETEKSFTLIDPVLGDNGELYQNLGNENIAAIKDLVRHADVITPNITEASILTSSDMKESYTNRDISAVVEKLRTIGPEKGIITSLPLGIGKLANVAYDGSDIRLFAFEDLSVSYPGSGDLFASLFLSLFMSGYSFFPSVKMAGEITTRAIRYAKEINRERRMGISLVSVMSDIKEILI